MKHTWFSDFLSELFNSTLLHVFPVAHENDELAEATLQKFPGDGGTYSTGSSSEEHTLTRELILESE